MISFKTILQYLTYPQQERSLFVNEFRSKNAGRLYFASIGVLFIALANIFLFTQTLPESDAKLLLWKTSLLKSHLVLLSTMFVLGIILHFIRKKKATTSKIVDVISHFSFMFILLMGVVISAIDQQVTSAINPFIITCLAVPVAILIPPVFSIVYFIIDYCVFLIVMPMVQSNPDWLISLEGNGATAFLIGIMFSFIFWHYNVIRFRQTRVIENQKTELENQNRELKRIAGELKQANDSKDKFFSIVAHDLRSPFNAILGFTELLSEDEKLMADENNNEIIRALRSSAVSYYRLLENLLEWSRAQRGLIEFKPMHLQLRPLIKECLDVVNESAERKNISIVMEINGNTTVFADENMISTVVRNLLYNAIKFTYPGGNIIINSKENDGIVSISVADTGIGMSEELVAKLFNQNEKTNRSGTDGEPSTGLGLLLCKDFVDRHNGTIQVKSKPGNGSVFIFTIGKLIAGFAPEKDLKKDIL